VRAGAWRHTLERVEAFARHNNDTVTLFPDSGQYDRFRKLAREMRRFSQVGAMVGGGTLSRPLVRFLITRGGVSAAKQACERRRIRSAGCDDPSHDQPR
jgi:hypothetical protein